MRIQSLLLALLLTLPFSLTRAGTRDEEVWLLIRRVCENTQAREILRANSNRITTPNYPRPTHSKPAVSDEAAIQRAQFLSLPPGTTLDGKITTDHRIYLQRMGQGIQKTTQELTRRLQENRNFSETEVRDWMRKVADVRIQAETDVFGNASVYGLEIPNRPEDMKEYMLEVWQRSAEAFPGDSLVHPEEAFYRLPYSAVDYIEADREFREHYLDAADRVVWQKKHPNPSITIEGKTYPLSTVSSEKFGQDLDYNVHHPTFVESAKMRDQAYGLLQKVLNSKSQTPSRETLNQLARAHFLFMHAVPFLRGSPSIVEAMMESVLQAKFNMGFPKTKIREPFWQAMFWKPNEKPDFTWDDLMSCYQR